MKRLFSFAIVFSLFLFSTSAYGFQAQDKISKPYSNSLQAQADAGALAITETQITGGFKLRGYEIVALNSNAYCEFWDNASVASGTCKADPSRGTQYDSHTVMFPENGYLRFENGLTTKTKNAIVRFFYE